MGLIDEVKNNLDRWEIAENQADVPDGKLRIVKEDIAKMNVKDLRKMIEGLDDDVEVVVSVDDPFYNGVATRIDVEENELRISKSDLDPSYAPSFKLVDKEEFEAAKSKVESEQVLGYVLKRSKLLKRIMKHAKAFIDDPEFANRKSFKIAVGSKKLYLSMLDAPSREKIDTYLDDIHNAINNKLNTEKYQLEGYELVVTNLRVIQSKKDIVSLDASIKIMKL
jgi:hypothetical protein